MKEPHNEADPPAIGLSVLRKTHWPKPGDRNSAVENGETMAASWSVSSEPKRRLNIDIDPANAAVRVTFQTN